MVELVAQELKNKYPTLSMDEGRVVAYAFLVWGRSATAMSGNPNTPPAGYFDSTIPLGISTIDFPQSTEAYCRHLLSEGFLCEHPSRRAMVRISDQFIPMCEKILNRNPVL